MMSGQKNRFQSADFSGEKALSAQIMIRYTVNESGCERICPERDIAVKPGPYSIDIPIGKHPDPNDRNAYYMLMEDPDGAPACGVIAPGETLVIGLYCIRLKCPAGSAFDPVTCACSFI